MRRCKFEQIKEQFQDYEPILLTLIHVLWFWVIDKLFQPAMISCVVASTQYKVNPPTVWPFNIIQQRGFESNVIHRQINYGKVYCQKTQLPQPGIKSKHQSWLLISTTLPRHALLFFTKQVLLYNSLWGYKGRKKNITGTKNYSQHQDVDHLEASELLDRTHRTTLR